MALVPSESRTGGGSKPPMCNKDRFANWKVRMQAYMDSIDEDLFETVLNGPYIPTKLAPTTDEPNRVQVKVKEEWTDSEKKAVQLDKKAKNILFQSLEDDLFENVVNCKTAKEVWEALLIMHEGTEEVRENKQSLLTQQYEMFAHVQGENVTATYERFNILLNSLRAYGKIYPNKDLTIKFMRALPSKWDAKTTAIRESKNLNEMTVQQLYGNLLTYELELTQRAETLSEGKRKEKGVALKATENVSKVITEIESDDDDEDNDDDIAMMVRKLRRFMRQGKASKQKKVSNYRSQEQINDLCYNCKKPGHFIADCNKPLREELKKKQHGKKEYKGSKRPQKRDKGLVAGGSWSDSDNDSNAESGDEEEPQLANLCLMAKNAKDKQSLNIHNVNLDEVFDFNSPDVDMDDLRTALRDITHDLHQYMKWFRVLSKDHSLLQEEKKKAQEELETALLSSNLLFKLEAENETLKQINTHHTQRESKLTSKIEELEKTISAWNKSSSSMDCLLSSQRSTFDRTGLGFGESIPEPSVEKTMETSSSNVSSLSRGIAFVKSSKLEEQAQPGSTDFSYNKGSHAGLGFIKEKSNPISTCQPRKIVESRKTNSTNQLERYSRSKVHSSLLMKPKDAWKRENQFNRGPTKKPHKSKWKMNYHTQTGMHHNRCFICDKHGHKATKCYYNSMHVRPKTRQVWVPKGTNKEGPMRIWVPK